MPFPEGLPEVSAISPNLTLFVPRPMEMYLFLAASFHFFWTSLYDSPVQLSNSFSVTLLFVPLPPTLTTLPIKQQCCFQVFKLVHFQTV